MTARFLAGRMRGDRLVTVSRHRSLATARRAAEGYCRRARSRRAWYSGHGILFALALTACGAAPEEGLVGPRLVGQGDEPEVPLPAPPPGDAAAWLPGRPDAGGAPTPRADAESPPAGRPDAAPGTPAPPPDALTAVPCEPESRGLLLGCGVGALEQWSEPWLCPVDPSPPGEQRCRLDAVLGPEQRAWCCLPRS